MKRDFKKTGVLEIDFYTMSDDNDYMDLDRDNDTDDDFEEDDFEPDDED